MPQYDTLENKVIKVGRAYQEGAEILATTGGKVIERLDKKNQS